MFIPKSLLSNEKLIFLLKHLIGSLPAPGAVIEIGVFQGGTLFEMKKYISQSHSVFGYDTFIGLPALSAEDYTTDAHLEGDFDDVAYDEMGLFFAEYGVSLVKCHFPVGVEDRQICFAHLDVDLYDSTLASLEYLARNLSIGGRVVVDDYDWERTPGIRRAIDDALLKYNLKVIDVSSSNQIVLVRK